MMTDKKPRLVVDNTPWKDKLQISSTGTAKPNLYNACIALRDAPEFRGKLAFDEFALETVVRGELPWSTDKDRAWTNHDDNCATEWAQKNDLNVGRPIIQMAVETVAYENRFHPVKSWLQSLTWDGTPRIHDWLIFYLGAERSAYVQAVGKAWLISAVARIMQPGCKADHVLIIEGPQGLRKSSALRALAGADWYTDELADMGSKDAAMQMRGVWVIELAELDHLRTGDVSRIKAVITRRVDRFRPPFGERLIKAPRECVFAGTVNPSGDYLKDDTGNRRFWPVSAGEAIDITALEDDRGQIWAEAMTCFANGEPWWLVDKDIAENAHAQQKARHSPDVWIEPVAKWLSTLNDTKTTPMEIFVRALGKREGDVTQKDRERLGAVMRAVGWRKMTVKIGGVPCNGFRRPDAVTEG